MKRLLAIFMTLCMVLGLSGVNVWAAEEAKWQAEAPMPSSKYSAASCVVGDKIYVVGGCLWNSGANYLDSVEIYNAKTNTWSTGKPMPEKRSEFSVSTVGSKIYVIGGKMGTNVYSSVLIYDTITDTWTTGKSMTKARNNLNSVTVGNKIYAIGGQGSDYIQLNTVEIYDTVTDTWSTGKPIPTARYWSSSCVVGDKIYVLGGYSNSTTIINNMETYDTKTDMWVTGDSFPVKASRSTCVTVGDNIYLIGGYNSQGCFGTVQIYSVSKNVWEVGSSLITARYMHTSSAVNGIIYVMNGSTGSNSCLNTMESLKVFTPQLSLLLNVDETVQLSVSYNLADNSNLTWSSTNEAVATVDKNGKVTAVGEGQADIYAQNADGTFKEFIPVKVAPGTANGMRLAAHLKVGEKVKLHLFDDPSKVTWKSMDESIATVSTTGQVTAAKKGLAIIQGELEGQTYQIYVRVNG